MLDKKFILNNIDAVRANVAARRMQIDLDRFVALAEERKRSEQRLQDLNREANTLASGRARQGAPDEAALARARALRDEIAAVKKDVVATADEFDAIHASIPNMTDARAPIGETDASNLVLGYGETPVRKFDFAPKDHLAIGKALDLIDMEAGSRVSGHGFYYLKNEAVLLDLALQRYALDVLARHGFTLVATPDMARMAVIGGTGFAPRGTETQIYQIAGTDLGLIATSEITLCGMYASHTFDASALPLKLAGFSHCFRTEAGSHGRETRGLYRVHQFSKVEMFGFTTPDQSEAMHQHFLDVERAIFDGLQIPYRFVENATGDLGAAAYRKFDLEAWMPGRGDGGEWGEVTSASNCTDYQARRLEIRYRPEDGKAAFAHTLNGTAIATSRALIAVIENHQNASGGVDIPAALQPYLGMKEIRARRSA